MDRRTVIAGAGVAALFGASEAIAETRRGAEPGRSVLDVGVAHNSERDQSAALQAAIDKIAGEGQAVFIPPGRYRASGVKLPAHVSILGAAETTVLSSPSGEPVFKALGAESVALRGLSFASAGLFAIECRAITICDCRVLPAKGIGFFCGGEGIMISGNRFSGCTEAAIHVDGDGMVTGNLVDGPGRFGIRLGSAARLGTVSAINNKISGSEIGIGISNSENGYAFVSLNMISGAKGGGIRALNGNAITGPDLARSSAESFRNFAIAANVSI